MVRAEAERMHRGRAGARKQSAVVGRGCRGGGERVGVLAVGEKDEAADGVPVLVVLEYLEALAEGFRDVGAASCRQ